jgi:hypothetical protein
MRTAIDALPVGADLNGSRDDDALERADQMVHGESGFSVGEHADDERAAGGRSRGGCARAGVALMNEPTHAWFR